MKLSDFFLGSVTDKTNGTASKMTDGVFKMLLRKFSVWLNDFTEPPCVKTEIEFKGGESPSWQEIEACYSSVRHSEIYYHAQELEETLQKNYKMKRFEIELMDRMIAEYNTKYKSPLAQALSEEGK